MPEPRNFHDRNIARTNQFTGPRNLETITDVADPDYCLSLEEALDISKSKDLAILQELQQKDDNFPRSVLQLYSQNETDWRYKFFLIYLLLGYTRSVSATWYTMYPNVRNKAAKNSNSYTNLHRYKVQYRWEERVHDWDTYQNHRTLSRIAYIQQTAPLRAWQVLDSFAADVENVLSAKPEIRLKAANDILDRTGYPRMSEKNITKTVTSINEMPNDQLAQMVRQYFAAKTISVSPLPKKVLEQTDQVQLALPFNSVVDEPGGVPSENGKSD